MKNTDRASERATHEPSPDGLGHPVGIPDADFILKRWQVSVSGYGEAIEVAASRGKALAKAWGCDAFSNRTFGQFLKMARCERADDFSPMFGDQITVEGRRAFFVNRNRAYVEIAYPNSDVVLSAHPFDILPMRYRPAAYRDSRSKPEGQRREAGSVHASGGAKQSPKEV